MAMPMTRPESTGDARVAGSSPPSWKNWSGNILYIPPAGSGTYYYSPTNRARLETLGRRAAAAGAKLRVSGQRHSQPPLVVDDNRSTPSSAAGTTWLVDLACYADLGPKGDQRIVLDPSQKTVTVNA